MKIWIHHKTGHATASLGVLSSLQTIGAKLGTTLVIDAVFHNGSTAVELPETVTGKAFTIKEASKYTAPALFILDEWTKGATPEDGYRFTGRLAGTALTTLLGNKPDLDLMCDIFWTVDGEDFATPRIGLKLQNQILRDDEPTLPDPESPWPLPGQIVRRSELGVAGGIATLGDDGKLASAQISAALLGKVDYKGTWDADTNTPVIPAAAAENKGWYYRVNVPGTTEVDEIDDWTIGDWIISDGTRWDKVDAEAAATIEIGEVTSLESWEQPTVANVGTPSRAILNIGIPRGPLNKFRHLALSGTEIDWSEDTYYYKTISANTTFSFAGLTNGICINVDLTTSSGAVPTWPVGIVWANKITPTHPTNDNAVYTFIRVNGVIKGAMQPF